MLTDPYKIAHFLVKVFATPLDVPSLERKALIKETERLLKKRFIPLSSAKEQTMMLMRNRREEVAQAARAGEPLWSIYDRLRRDRLGREVLPELEKSLAENLQHESQAARAGLLNRARIQRGQRRDSQAFLEEIRRQAQPVLDFLETGAVFITPHLQVSFSQTPQGIKEKIVPAEASAWVFTSLILPLFETRPFPFGKCAVCGQVFVQARRGKPRRYCSSSCRAKGMPSAAKRTEYMRTQRQRQRKRDLDKAQRIIRKASSEQKQLELLGKEFPQKSRRQLLHLLKRATQTIQEV